ncbi:Periplasmic serine endoprotease DegP precursor [Planctomycetes bacterium CA13]|uniref:Periplasmic serine endoprotease DegP n=1 Tax=Novipirellula herctigrandis TaxID=2527986 RepID=A0A5C5YWS4_9BACT|nr:Periplasmic serine endoprotease DegP precursor [Planctomycetes bacterium CA13]
MRSTCRAPKRTLGVFVKRCFLVCFLALFASTLEPIIALGQDVAFRSAMAKAVRATASRALPSIVAIEIVGGSGIANGEVEQDAPTSGVIVDSDGHIIASRIVVRRPSASILVVLADGSRHAAKVVSQDFHRDLVLLKIETDRPLAPIELPESVDLKIGQTTVAVGRYGSEASPIVSHGVLSGRDRLDGIALQSDARVSPSLYGGLLLDLYGNPLGVLIAAVAEGGAEDDTSWYDSGIAFAIPTNAIRKNLDRMRAGEAIKKGLLGIVAKSKDPYENNTEIAAIRLRSPAELAGLEAGDQVISVADEKVRRQQEIRQVLGRFDAGDTIAVQVERDGNPIRVELTLTESIPPLNPQRLGVVVTNQNSKEPGDEPTDAKEVVVKQIIEGTPADGKLEIGDVLLKLGQVELDEVNSLRRQMISAEPGTSLDIQIRRDGEESVVDVTPASVADSEIAELPTEFANKDAAWTIEELRLPDAANAAGVLVPSDEDDRSRLGLLVLVLNPGKGAPKDVLVKWKEAAGRAGVVVCAVAPESNERWQPKEIDTVARFVASIEKTQPIASSAVAIAASGALTGSKAGAADSMALAVAMSASRTFSGVAISAETRPPAVRLRENDAESSLQLLLPIGRNDDLPTWVPTLTKSGYPVQRGGEVEHGKLLRWVRLLQAI